MFCKQHIVRLCFLFILKIFAFKWVSRLLTFHVILTCLELNVPTCSLYSTSHIFSFSYLIPIFFWVNWAFSFRIDSITFIVFLHRMHFVLFYTFWDAYLRDWDSIYDSYFFTMNYSHNTMHNLLLLISVLSKWVQHCFCPKGDLEFNVEV